MSTALGTHDAIQWTLADLIERLGPMPIARIRTTPRPGTATEDDFLAIDAQSEPLCELIDGVLVEKTMGVKEAILASWISTLLNTHVLPRGLGVVVGSDGPVRLQWGQIRLPDVSFISQERLTGSNWRGEPILTCAPNLAVEVLSLGNTRKEMERKLVEYFDAGVEVTWYVDPGTKTVRVYHSPGEFQEMTIDDQLTGGVVLPEFSVSVAEVFSVWDKLPTKDSSP